MDGLGILAGEINAQTAAPIEPVAVAAVLVEPITSSEKTFTQSEVNAMMAARVARVRAPESNQDTIAALTARLDEQELERKFDKSLIGMPVNQAQADRLFRLYKADKPADINAWLADTMSAFGLAKPVAATIAAVAPTDSVPRTAMLQTENGITDLRTLTMDQVTRLGPKGLREILERTLASAPSNQFAPPRPNTGRK